MTLTGSNRIWLFTGTATSAVFLWFALRGTNIDEISHSFARANLLFAPPLVACLIVFYWLRAERWKLLLRPIRVIRTKTLFPVLMIGHAANLVLPMQLGEVVRAFLGARRTGISIAPILSTLMLERLLDSFIILGALAYGLSAGEQLPAGFAMAGLILAALLIVSSAVIAVSLVNTRATLGRLEQVTGFLPSVYHKRFLQQIEAAIQGLQSLKNPSLLGKVIGISIIQISFMWLCVYLSIQAFAIDVPMSAIFLTLAFMALSVIVPSAPGFIGSIQLAYALALRPFGAASANAFAASVFYHSLMFASVMLIGLVFLHKLGYTFKLLQVKAASEVSSRSNQTTE